MTEIFNLLEEYKELYHNVKREKDKYIEVMLQMKDTMETMRDTLDTMKQLISELKRDNRMLRSELTSQLSRQESDNTIVTQLDQEINNIPHIIPNRVSTQVFPIEIMDPEM